MTSGNVLRRTLPSAVTLVWAMWFGGNVALFAFVQTLFHTPDRETVDASHAGSTGGSVLPFRVPFLHIASHLPDRESAAAAASTLFVFFERYQLLLGIVAVCMTLAWRVLAPSRRLTLVCILFVVALADAGVSGSLVTPRIEAMREQHQTQTAEFGQMHAVSGILFLMNTTALLAAGIVLPAAIRTARTERRTLANLFD